MYERLIRVSVVFCNFFRNKFSKIIQTGCRRGFVFVFHAKSIAAEFGPTNLRRRLKGLRTTGQEQMSRNSECK